VELFLKQIRDQAHAENLRVTQHAHEEMIEEAITLGNVLEAIATGTILENYPESTAGVHVVCLAGSLEAVARCMLCAPPADQCLSSLRFTNRNRHGG
jgi:hypothetical protein